ncbi:MAG: magnesium transporter CorA family protein [Nitrosopumilaceae archaeon]
MKGDSFVSKLRPGRKAAFEEISTERHFETITGDNFSWIDLVNPIRSDVEVLAKKYNFNTLNIEDSLAKFELPKLDSYDDHVFIILHFPPLASRSLMPKVSQLAIFIGRDFLVTIHQGDLKPLVDMVNACKENIDSERKKRLMGKSTAYLLHDIIDVLVDDLLHTSRRIIGNLTDIEDSVFDENKSAARKISLLRREIITLKRLVNPLKRIVLETAKNIQRFSKSAEEITLYFDDVIDHIDKVLETLEESRETMEIYKDTDFMLSTEKSNKILAVLTIIFTLAIPATVIGTFYGMNINLPGGIETGNLNIFGPYSTLIFILLASIIPALLMLAYFRKLGWVGN